MFGASGASIAPTMNRRAFFTGLGAVLAAPLGAQAQQAGKVYRIGYLSSGTVTGSWSVETFRGVLRELGWIEGQNLVIEYRFAETRYDRLPGLVAELVHLKVDVIVAVAAPAIRAAKDATTTIPIVMAIVVDPVATKFVASLARPEGNITGVSSTAPTLVPKQLEMLKEIIPKISRVAALWNPGNPGNEPQLREATMAAKTLGIQLQPVEARNPTELDRAFAAIARHQPDAMIVLTDVMLVEHRTRVAKLAAEHRIPAAYGRPEHVEAGGLMAYSASRSEMFRSAAVYVDKILRGAKPADLPVEQPTKFELVINLKTAKALGVTIPPSLLLRADLVID